MVPVTSRPWRGYGDLRGLQQLAVEHRRLAGPRAPWYVGDIAWGFRQHAGREGEWRVRIWGDEGAVVAWSRLQGGGTLDLDVHPGDDANTVGELEPVGVRGEFRRRGLGAAVCSYALRCLHDEGGREAVVYCLTEAACALYESIGFRRHAKLVGYSR